MPNTYTVIICPECQLPQIVGDDPKTTQCKRCQERLKFRELKHFFEASNGEVAREARGEIDAKLQGYGAEYADLIESGAFDNIETSIDDAVLREHGFSEAVTDDDSSSGSHLDIVSDAIKQTDAPTKESVIDYAVDRGVPKEKVEKLIRRMQQRGDIIVTGGRLRLL